MVDRVLSSLSGALLVRYQQSECPAALSGGENDGQKRDRRSSGCRASWGRVSRWIRSGTPAARERRDGG